MPALVEYRPDGSARQSWTLDCKHSFVIGRNPDQAEIVIRHASVSRKHAVIKPLSRLKFKVVDLGAVNGTFVDGCILRREIEVQVGEDRVFRFGESDYDYKIVEVPTDSTTSSNDGGSLRVSRRKNTEKRSREAERQDRSPSPSRLKRPRDNGGHNWFCDSERLKEGNKSSESIGERCGDRTHHIRDRIRQEDYDSGKDYNRHKDRMMEKKQSDRDYQVEKDYRSARESKIEKKWKTEGDNKGEMDRRVERDYKSEKRYSSEKDHKNEKEIKNEPSHRIEKNCMIEKNQKNEEVYKSDKIRRIEKDCESEIDHMEKNDLKSEIPQKSKDCRSGTDQECRSRSSSVSKDRKVRRKTKWDESKPETKFSDQLPAEELERQRAILAQLASMQRNRQFHCVSGITPGAILEPPSEIAIVDKTKPKLSVQEKRKLLWGRKEGVASSNESESAGAPMATPSSRCLPTSLPADPNNYAKSFTEDQEKKNKFLKLLGYKGEVSASENKGSSTTEHQIPEEEIKRRESILESQFLTSVMRSDGRKAGLGA